MKNLSRGEDNMERIKKLTILFLFGLILSSFRSGVPEEAIGRMDAEAEIWDLRITGDTEAKLRMRLTRAEMGNNTYAIAGSISGKIGDHVGGLKEAN
jgi:hypothetical protein